MKNVVIRSSFTEKRQGLVDSLLHRITRDTEPRGYTPAIIAHNRRVRGYACSETPLGARGPWRGSCHRGRCDVASLL